MTVYKKKNGKWYCKFQVKGQQRHLLCDGAKTKLEAQALEDAEKFKLRQQMAGILPREEKSLDLNMLLKLYDRHNQVNNKDKTHTKKKIETIRDYFGGCTKVDKIRKSDVERFRKYLLDKKKLASATVNRYVNVLSKSYNLALDDEHSNRIIFKNPCKNLKKLKEDNEIIRYLTTDEEKSLFSYLPIHLKPIVICALQTGLRRSNILNMRWEQINLDFGFIEVLKQHNKGHKIIKIPISAKLRKVFEDLQPKSEGYVFANPETNKPYNDIREGFNNAVRKAGMPKFRFHDLRHTVATRLVEKGIDLTVVKELLAHSEITTTMKYAHPVPKRKLEAIEVLNSYNQDFIQNDKCTQNGHSENKKTAKHRRFLRFKIYPQGNSNPCLHRERVI